MMKEISQRIPEFKMPKLYSSQQDKLSLIDEVTSGAHPETEEGVMIYKLDQPAPYKSKKKKD